VILFDPQKHPEAKQLPARRFADWLASAEGQAAIGAYELNGEQLFHPSAAAEMMLHGRSPRRLPQARAARDKTREWFASAASDP
jgi:hypothetical protein